MLANFWPEISRINISFYSLYLTAAISVNFWLENSHINHTSFCSLYLTTAMLVNFWPENSHINHISFCSLYLTAAMLVNFWPKNTCINHISMMQRNTNKAKKQDHKTYHTITHPKKYLETNKMQKAIVKQTVRWTTAQDMWHSVNGMRNACLTVNCGNGKHR